MADPQNGGIECRAGVITSPENGTEGGGWVVDMAVTLRVTEYAFSRV